ncbi:MAG: ribonuclease HII, partial [Deltaproteobacteria bacterium]|nr:ribonuclease HII [Deltaproteobacteria bacterium]
MVAGVDEAGRGPLAGPVMAGAVVLPPGFTRPEIVDSKVLSPKARERAFSLIISNALAFAVG